MLEDRQKAKEADKLLPGTKPVRATPSQGGRTSHCRIEFFIAVAGLAQRWIKKNACRETAASGRRQERHQRRNRMKNTYFRFFSIEAVDGRKNTVVVLNQCWKVMLFLISDIIPAMVSHVIDNQVEVVGEEGPERVVEVDRQTVAVTQNESRSSRVSMTPQTNDGVIVHADFINRKRLGYLPYRCRGRCQWNPLPACSPRGEKYRLAHKEASTNFPLPRSSGRPLRKLKYARRQTPAHEPGISNRDIPTTTPMPSALISAFQITKIFKNQCRLTVKHMPAGAPCTTACGLPWAETSKIRCPFLQPYLHKKWRRSPCDTRRTGVTGRHVCIIANATVLSHRATPRHPRCGPHEASD